MHVTLLIVLLAANVLFRTFTNGFGILPKAFNVIDIPLVAFIFLIYLTRGSFSLAPAWVSSIRRRTYLFGCVLAVGILLNTKYIYTAAILSQITMLLLPFILFIAVASLP